MSKSCAYAVNIIHAVLGLILACTGLWLFIEVNSITSLRNSNHYLLDYNLYWPQVIPWLFILIGVLVIFVACCGVFGATKKSKGLVFTHIVCISMTVLLTLTVAIVALVFANSKSTENFIKDTVWDVFFQTKTDTEVADAFGRIEKRMQCCGAESPRDYVNWKDDFPQSCCDTYYHGWLEPYTVDCEITNKRANERHGCSSVATQYIRIAVFVLSGVSILTSLLGLAVLASAVSVSKALRPKPRNVTAKYESESKKVLL
ncbi:unnamed protein product [Chilo suppressalis]|uniref:Tetraspanin n=1 Tax=Chilo suppressalis TaxID=168631 RepID=A0ABN8B8D9_CHISP|nr:unnamed protein product [Chilo suppressalis]